MQAPVVQHSSTASNFTSTRTGRPCASNVQFRCNFESGNIGEVRQLSEYEYDIKIRPDTNNSRHRLWFYFSASNIVNNQQVLLNIVNFSKTKSLYREGLAPVVCSRRRPQWNRIPSSQVLYYRSPKGPGNRMAYVMSFLFQFDGADDGPYFFAYSFPYTYTDLQRYLYSLERQHLPFLRREILCRTLQQRRVDLLTITAPEGEAGARPLQERKWVFLSARVHPGETPAQFIIHGVIDFLTSESSRARVLRANVVFKIAPMLNPDGVANGNYRCSYLGFDLNRHWLAPSAWAQPEILSVKTLVTELHQDPSVDLDFYIDIHAHSVGTNSFMYGNNIPTRRKEWTAPAAAGADSSSTPSSSPRGSSSPRPGTLPDSIQSSRPQPGPQQAQPPVLKKMGYQAVGTTSSSPRQELAPPKPTPTSATPSALISPPPKPPPASATEAAAAAARSKPTEKSRPSHSAPAEDTAAVSVEAAGRPSTPLTPAKSVTTSGATGRGSGGGGGGGNSDNNKILLGGGVGGGGGNARNKAGAPFAAVRSGGSGAGARACENIDPNDDFDPYGDVVSAFPRMLAHNAPDFSFARSKFDADPSKEGTGRRALGQLLSPDVLCFTLEASFYASQRDGSVGLVPYTRGGYIELGRSLASTFFDYYGLAC